MAENKETPQEPIIEPDVEPRTVEGRPEMEPLDPGILSSWYRSFQKFTQERIYTEDEFFDEISYQFRGVPYRPRASRAGQGSGRISGPPLPVPPAFPNIAPKPSESFMEQLEQGLMAKFRPEDRASTMYRTMREAERKEGQVKDYKVKSMSPEAFLEDLKNQISSVQWKEPKASHKATLARPGLRQNLQKELDNGSY